MDQKTKGGAQRVAPPHQTKKLPTMAPIGQEAREEETANGKTNNDLPPPTTDATETAKTPEEQETH